MTDFGLSLGPDPARFGAVDTPQLADQFPVADRLAAERAFRHAMRGNEGVDFGEDRGLHGGRNMRVDTRMSSAYAGEGPLLRDAARMGDKAPMENAPRIDVAELKRAVIGSTGPGRRFTRRALSLAASGGKNPDLIRDLLSRGQDKKVSIETAAGIAQALGVDLGLFLAASPAGSTTAQTIRVIGCVEAGAWRQHETWEISRQYEVQAAPIEFDGVDRFGLEVVGFSMDLRFLPGTILDCLRVPNRAGLSPIPGDIVIVQRRLGDLWETTCKRLEQLGDGTYQLRAESSRPEFGEPIRLGRPDDGHFSDDEIVIVGVVNSAITQVLRRNRG